MTPRIQIELDRDLLSRVHRKATAQSISVTEYLRRLIASDLGEPGHADPSLVFNLGDSDGSDIAHSRDRVVAEALDSEFH